MTRSILTRSVGPLYATTLTISDPSPEGIRSWRVDARNRVDYLRRVDPRWRRFGVHVWLQHDGTIRGVVSLSALGPAEVTKGLARWGAVLGAETEPEDLRVAIWAAMKPQAVYVDGPQQGRYWPVRCSIWPCRVTPQNCVGMPTRVREQIEPMPSLL